MVICSNHDLISLGSIILSKSSESPFINISFYDKKCQRPSKFEVQTIKRIICRRKQSEIPTRKYFICRLETSVSENSLLLKKLTGKTSHNFVVQVEPFNFLGFSFSQKWPF